MSPAVFAANVFGVPFYWHLPVLIAVISVVYSATRFERWDHIFREAFRWGLRMGAFLLGILVVLYLVGLWV